MTPTWRCGHPKTPENTRNVGEAGFRCKTCRSVIEKHSYEKKKALGIERVRPESSKDPLYHRLRHLPDQLIRARARVRQLETEALRYGLTELLGHRQ